MVFCPVVELTDERVGVDRIGIDACRTDAQNVGIGQDDPENVVFRESQGFQVGNRIRDGEDLHALPSFAEHRKIDRVFVPDEGFRIVAHFGASVFFVDPENVCQRQIRLIEQSEDKTVGNPFFIVGSSQREEMIGGRFQIIAGEFHFGFFRLDDFRRIGEIEDEKGIDVEESRKIATVSFKADRVDAFSGRDASFGSDPEIAQRDIVQFVKGSIVLERTGRRAEIAAVRRKRVGIRQISVENDIAVVSQVFHRKDVNRRLAFFFVKRGRHQNPMIGKKQRSFDAENPFEFHRRGFI